MFFSSRKSTLHPIFSRSRRGGLFGGAAPLGEAVATVVWATQRGRLRICCSRNLSMDMNLGGSPNFTRFFLDQMKPGGLVI